MVILGLVVDACRTVLAAENVFLFVVLGKEQKYLQDDWEEDAESRHGGAFVVLVHVHSLRRGSVLPSRMEQKHLQDEREEDAVFLHVGAFVVLFHSLCRGSLLRSRTEQTRLLDELEEAAGSLGAVAVAVSKFHHEKERTFVDHSLQKPQELAKVVELSVPRDDSHVPSLQVPVSRCRERYCHHDRWLDRTNFQLWTVLAVHCSLLYICQTPYP